jgi:hypothetical protein
MNAHSEIVRLFKSLSEDEKGLVLKELGQASMGETVLLEEADVVCCPHCESRLFVRNGKRGTEQKYKCKACCKVFTAKTGTTLHRLQKPEKFELYRSRHKILSGTIKDDKSFKGITEIDDIWFLYSQKGRKGLDYSRKRGGSKRAGDNDFQAKLLITADRNHTTDMSLVRIGRLKKADIERKVSGRFSGDCKLVSDKHRSIAAFAKSENVKHISFKASEHTAGGEYHVQNINNMASGLKSVVNGALRGVSTKYLQNYANWYRIRSKKMDEGEMGRMLLLNKDVTSTHMNREDIYKWFIENFSKRTYRCPVKKTYRSAFDHETLAKLNLV